MLTSCTKIKEYSVEMKEQYNYQILFKSNIARKKYDNEFLESLTRIVVQKLISRINKESQL